MCLNRIVSKQEKKEILDKITRKGIKVYKVALLRTRSISVGPEYYSPYIGGSPPYKGKMEAKLATIKPICNGFIGQAPINYKQYKSGFHFFTSKRAAQRLCGRGSEDRYTVISATIYKSWITEIGTEAGFNNAHERDWRQQEIVVVAKKAIFD